MQSRSPCLLTAVLYASSKFFRADLKQGLFEQSQASVNRSIASGRCDIGLIQSLMILVYWKAPTDATAWLKVGMAVRMGFQLRWHIPSAGVIARAGTAPREILVSSVILTNAMLAKLIIQGRAAHLVL